MATRTFLSAIAVAGFLVGCTTVGISKNSNNCDDQGPCRAKIDRVQYGHVVRYEVNPEQIHLVRGKHDIHIIWTLENGDYFCSAQGNSGVLFKYPSDDDGQFEDRRPTDNENGDPTSEPDCKKHKHFHWKALNTVPNKDYRYQVLFFDKNGVAKSVDPWVYND